MNKLIYKLKSKLIGIKPKERAKFLRTQGILNCGKHCEIHHSVTIGSEPYLIKMGSHVRVTAGVKFFNHDGGMWVIRNLKFNQRADKVEPITIGDNVFIGQNTMIMPGVEIGSNVIIGAGSIVTKNLPSNIVAVGMPATIIGNIKDYYKKNIDKIESTKHYNYHDKKNYYLKKFNI